MPPLMLGRQGQHPLGVFADRHTLLGHFEPMVNAVTHQVCEWVDNTFDKAFVELSRLTTRNKADFFAQALRIFSYHTGEAIKYIVNRHHAYRHHRLLRSEEHTSELHSRC